MKNTDEQPTKGVWPAACHRTQALNLSYLKYLLQKVMSAKDKSMEDLWLLWKLDGVIGKLAEKEGGPVCQTATANKTSQVVGGRKC